MKSFIKGLILALGLLIIPAVAHAQTATTASKFVWVQPSVADAPTAQAFTYKIYDDGSTTARTLTGVTCSASGTPVVVSCQAPIPAYTPGAHTTQLTASNVAGESPKTAPLSFTFVIVPATPSGFGIQ